MVSAPQCDAASGYTNMRGASGIRTIAQRQETSMQSREHRGFRITAHAVAIGGGNGVQYGYEGETDAPPGTTLPARVFRSSPAVRFDNAATALVACLDAGCKLADEALATPDGDDSAPEPAQDGE